MAPTARGKRSPRRANSHVAAFTVEFGGDALSRKRLAAVEAALRPEISGGASAAPGVAGDRVFMRRSNGGRALEVRVTSRSLASLRAALNSHMRMASLAADVAAVAVAEEE